MITRGEAQTGAIKRTALTTTTTAVNRRAALGDLATNRARGVVDVKKSSQIVSNEKSTVTTTTIDLKNVKPRVDTHWTNEPIRRTSSRNNSTSRTSANSSGNSVISTNTAKLVSKLHSPIKFFSSSNQIYSN